MHTADADTCDAGQRCVTNDAGRGFCRAAIGAPCRATSACEGTDAPLCSTDLDPLVRGAIENAFDGAICLQEGCASDDECPGAAVCRPLNEDGTARACLSPCEGDYQCRFNEEYRCLGASDRCEIDDTRCMALFGTHKLCVLPRP